MCLVVCFDNRDNIFFVYCVNVFINFYLKGILVIVFVVVYEGGIFWMIYIDIICVGKFGWVWIFNVFWSFFEDNRVGIGIIELFFNDSFVFMLGVEWIFIFFISFFDVFKKIVFVYFLFWIIVIIIVLVIFIIYF